MRLSAPVCTSLLPLILSYTRPCVRVRPHHAPIEAHRARQHLVCARIKRAQGTRLMDCTRPCVCVRQMHKVHQAPHKAGTRPSGTGPSDMCRHEAPSGTGHTANGLITQVHVSLHEPDVSLSLSLLLSLSLSLSLSIEARLITRACPYRGCACAHRSLLSLSLSLSHTHTLPLSLSLSLSLTHTRTHSLALSARRPSP